MKILIAVLIAAFAFIAPASAQECVTIDVATKRMVEQGIPPTKILTGTQAVMVGKKLGAPYETSHLLLHVKGEEVMVIAFKAGCFTEVVVGRVEVFKKLAPGVL